MSFLDWLFKPTKKPKKKDSKRWAKQATKAKNNTQSNSKRHVSKSSRPSTRSASSKTPSSSSRRGSYVSQSTTQRAQSNSSTIIKAHNAYKEGLREQRKDDKAHDAKYGKSTIIRPRSHRFYEANNKKSTFVQNSKGKSSAYKSPTDFYKQNKGEQKYVKDKIERDYKTNPYKMGWLDAYRANFFGEDNAAKKVSERIGTKVNVDLNSKAYQSGKQMGDITAYAIPAMAQSKIAKVGLRGAKVLTEVTTKGKAVTNATAKEIASKVVKREAPKVAGKTVGKKAPKLADTISKAKASHLVKKAKKTYTKADEFKANMKADVATSTPMNISYASVESKRVVEENKEQKKKLKAQADDASKYLSESKKAVSKYNKAISDVRKSSLPDSEKQKYISNLKEERNKLIQKRRQVADSKEQMDSQRKSLSTNQNKEFFKTFVINETMDRIMGTGLSALTAKGGAKTFQKASVSKGKLRKVKGVNLEKAKAKADADIVKEIDEMIRPKKTAIKGKKGKVKAPKEVTIKNLRTGKEITAKPRTKAEKKILLKTAAREAGGMKNISIVEKNKAITKDMEALYAKRKRGAITNEEFGKQYNELVRKQAELGEPAPIKETPKASEPVKQPKAEEPTSPVDAEIKRIENEQAKLKEQYDKGEINGADFADRHIALNEQKERVRHGEPIEAEKGADVDPEIERLQDELDDLNYRYNATKSSENMTPSAQGKELYSLENRIRATEKEINKLKKAKENATGETAVTKAEEVPNEKVTREAPEATAKEKPKEEVAEEKVAEEKAEEKPPEDGSATASVKINRDIEKTSTEVPHNPLTKLREKVVDTGAAVEDIGRDLIKNGDEAGKALGEDIMGGINEVRQATTKAQFHLTNAQRNYNGTVNMGKSASAITTPIRKECDQIQKETGADAWEDFQRYVYAKHNLDRAEQGKSVFGKNATKKDSEAWINSLSDKYSKETLDKFDEWQTEVRYYFDNLQQMRVDAGIVSKDAKTILDDMYENYIQTQRANRKAAKGISIQGNTVGAREFKSAKETDLPLRSIEDQMRIATERVYKEIANNDLIKKLIKANGGKAEVDPDMTLESVMDDVMFTGKDKNGTYNLRVFENGKVKKYPCTKDVHDAIKALNSAGINPANYSKWINRALEGSAGVNSVFKKLVTEWNPFFALYRNPMKDIGDALMYSKDFKSFVTHMPQAIKHMVKRDEYWDLWLSSGGTSSSFFESVRSLKVSKNPIAAMNQLFEQFPRMTEFSSMIDKQLKAAGHKAGELQYLTKDMVNKASQAGADITVNFGRGGTITKNLNKYAVPFMNPSVQGLSKAARTLITERHGAKAWIGLAVKASIFGFTPAVIQELVYKNDKDYQMLNARDKANNILIKKDDGTFAKFPIGRLIADLGAPVRKITSDAAGTDGYTWKDVAAVIENNSAPANPIDDNLFMPILNTFRNKTWYGGKIQSDWETENRAPKNIYDANTTNLSKWFARTATGEKIGLSPKQLDYLMKSYSGVVGEIGMPLMTQKAKGGGLLTGAKAVTNKTFTLNPTYQNKLQGDFFEKQKEIKKSADGGNARDKKRTKQYDKMLTRLGTFNKVIKNVEKMNVSYDKKNEIVDALTEKRNEMLLKFNKTEKVPADSNTKDMEIVREIVGAKQAINSYASDKTKAMAKKYGDYDKFYDTYKVMKPLTAHKGRTSGVTKAIALEQAGADKKLQNLYEVKDEDRQVAKEYYKNGGNVEEYTRAKELTKGTGRDYMKKAFNLAAANAPDRVYKALGIYENKMRAARVLSQSGISASQAARYKEKADADGNGYFKKVELANFFNSTKLSGKQKAALFSAWARKGTANPYGEVKTPKKNYQLKGVKTDTQKRNEEKNISPLRKEYWKPDKNEQVDWNSPEAKEFMNAFGVRTDKERRRVGEKLYRAAKASKKGINAPYKNDKDYLPKETLQVVRSGDKRLDAEALKALKTGGIKKIVRDAQKTLPKIKESDDKTKFDDDTKKGGGGRRGYRRYHRRGRGGRGRSGGSGGTAIKPIEEVKATKSPTLSSGGSHSTKISYDPSTWTPTMVKTKRGWTDAQIRKVFNSLIAQGLSERQAITRLASLYNTRFS